MKKLVVILGIIFIGSSSFTATSNLPDKAFIQQLYVMLDNLPLEIEEEILVEVAFTLNAKNQIAVLSVEAEDPFVRKLIKKRLDNKTVAIPIKSAGTYLLPIRIKL